MGWLFTEGQTKSELITHLTEGDSKLRTLRKSVRGNALWTIQEDMDYPGPFIIVYLLRSQRGYGWGYKPVTESMGPAETSCPISYLDQVPMPDGNYAHAWRERVRSRHAEKQRITRLISAAKIGDPVTLTVGCEPRTVALKSKKPLLGQADDGSVWRIPRRLIASIGVEA